MSYAETEMKILRQVEATRGIDGNIEFDLEAIQEYMESLAWFNDQESPDKMAKMVGWIGISLISICATLDVNFSDCLNIAYEEVVGNQEVFEEDQEMKTEQHQPLLYKEQHHSDHPLHEHQYSTCPTED
jgi:hypothetical protein